LGDTPDIDDNVPGRSNTQIFNANNIFGPGHPYKQVNPKKLYYDFMECKINQTYNDRYNKKQVNLML